MYTGPIAEDHFHLMPGFLRRNAVTYTRFLGITKLVDKHNFCVNKKALVTGICSQNKHACFSKNKNSNKVGIFSENYKILDIKQECQIKIGNFNEKTFFAKNLKKRHSQKSRDFVFQKNIFVF
jgi:hypothetical protein